MGRTIRDTVVYGQPLERVRNEVMAWVSTNRIRVLDTSPTSVRGRSVPWYMWGPISAILGAGNYFELTFKQDRGTIVVHTEGYVKSFGSEQDFSPDAVMGGLPRRRGWNAVQDLWNRLAYLSPGSPGEGALSCGSCGSPVREGAQFCGNCGRPIVLSEVRPRAQVFEGTAVVSPVQPPSTAKSCPNCGTRIGEEDRFCRSCGKATVPAESPPAIYSPRYQSPAVPPTPMVRGRFCGSCGYNVQEGHRFCPSCGLQL